MTPINLRTLTDNPQAAELIAAVRDLKPQESKLNLQASLDVIAADNASYAAIVQPWTIPEQAQPLDLSPYAAFMAGILLLLLLIQGLCKSRKK